MDGLMMILVTLAVWLPVVLLGMYVQSCRIRRRLTARLTCLFRGEAVPTEDFAFDGVRPEQLQYPFTALDGRIIAAARELRRDELTVKLVHPLPAVFGRYEFHIRGCFEGLDAQGTPFTLEREGYVCIWCGMRRGHVSPCITDVRTCSHPVPE